MPMRRRSGGTRDAALLTSWPFSRISPACTPSNPAGVRERRHPLGAIGWMAVAVGLALLVPIVAVLGNMFAPGEGTWTHHAQTVLPDYVSTTAVLLLGVTAGVLVLGVA